MFTENINYFIKYKIFLKKLKTGKLMNHCTNGLKLVISFSIAEISAFFMQHHLNGNPDFLTTLWI